jgi:hypothetical protein
MKIPQFTLAPLDKGFEQFQYQYQMLLDQVSQELAQQEESAALSFFPSPDARFTNVVAVAVCFHTNQWVIGRLAGDLTEQWGLSEINQKLNPVVHYDSLSDAVSDLIQQIQHLMLAKAERLRADWENARIQAEITTLTKQQKFQWPSGVALALYEWSWINYLGGDGDEDRSERWSLVDHPDETGYVPFTPEGYSVKQTPDLLRLDNVSPVIRRVEIACTEDVPDRALVSRSFTVAGIIRHTDGKGQYAYKAGNETIIHYSQAHPIIQDAAMVLQAQQQGAIAGNGLELSAVAQREQRLLPQ